MIRDDLKLAKIAIENENLNDTEIRFIQKLDALSAFDLVTISDNDRLNLSLCAQKAYLNGDKPKRKPLPEFMST